VRQARKLLFKAQLRRRDGGLLGVCRPIGSDRRFRPHVDDYECRLSGTL